jgi:hypothetical protein
MNAKRIRIRRKEAPDKVERAGKFYIGAVVEAMGRSGFYQITEFIRHEDGKVSAKAKALPSLEPRRAPIMVTTDCLFLTSLDDIEGEIGRVQAVLSHLEGVASLLVDEEMRAMLRAGPSVRESREVSATPRVRAAQEAFGEDIDDTFGGEVDDGDEYDPEGDFGTYVPLRTRNTNGST